MGFILKKFSLNDSATGMPMPPGPIPDIRDVGNQIGSACGRYGCEMPPINKNRIQDFLKFAYRFIDKFPKANKADLLTREQWLESRHYNLGRKKYFHELFSVEDYLRESHVNSEAFLKNEIYDKFKCPRAINSVSDYSKMALGPYIHLLDKTTFTMRWFVKGIDPKLWPDELHRTFGLDPVFETDFSSFEAHHHDEYCSVLTYWVDHVIGDILPRAERDLIVRIMSGENKCTFSDIETKIWNRLMSGCLWTSSGNAVLNLILLNYLFSTSAHPTKTSDDRCDWAWHEARIKVEGDDGAMSLLPPGSTKAVIIDEKIIDELGLKLKFEYYDNYGLMSFCGVICSPGNVDIIADPIKIIRNIFVLDSKYYHLGNKKRYVQGAALLRARALSMKYRLSNCPIVGPLMDWILAKTHWVNKTQLSRIISLETKWTHPMLESACVEDLSRCWKNPSNPSYEMRALMEAKFGLCVAEQLQMENDIRNTGSCFLFPYYSLQHLDHFIKFGVAHDGKIAPSCSDKRLDTMIASGLKARAKSKAKHHNEMFSLLSVGLRVTEI